MNKEEIYDSDVAPLMDKIISICQTNGIAMFCSFRIPTPTDTGMTCSTHLPDENGDFEPAYKKAVVAVYGKPV